MKEQTGVLGELYVWDEAVIEMDALKAENKRLRTALEQIENHRDRNISGSEYLMGAASGLRIAGIIARDALVVLA